MLKSRFNKAALQFIEIALEHGRSPVNLLYIFRTPFYKNISGGLLPNDLTFSGKQSENNNNMAPPCQKRIGVIKTVVKTFVKGQTASQFTAMSRNLEIT